MSGTAAESEERTPEDSLAAVVRAAMDAAAVMDVNGTILAWNEAAVELLGWSQEEAVGGSLDQLIVPERNRKRLRRRLTLYRDGLEKPPAVRRFQTDGVNRDGQELPVELSISPYENKGRLYFCAFVRDLRSQLSEAEERGRLAAIVDSSTDAIIGKDLHGIITSWNSGAELVYGYSAEQAIGQPVSIIIPEEVSEEEPELREVLTAGTKLQSFEAVRRRSDGRLIDVSISVSPIRNAAGEITGSATIERDITQERANRLALEEREEQIRLLLESTAEAIYGVDLDGICTFCNPACVQMLGYDSTSDLIGRNMHHLIHHHRADGSEYPLEECHIFQAFRGGHGTHIDDEVLWRSDGSSFPAEYWSYPMRRGGRICGSVVTFVDITERLDVEHERMRLASLVESSTDPIVALDLNGRIESWNDSARKLFQFTEKEVVGQPVDVIVSEARRAVVRDAVKRGERIAQRELRCLRRDGTTFIAALTISPIHDLQGRHVGASVIARDISRRKQRERELREARDAAEAANQAKSEFLANISHELRTPMNAIIGMIELSAGEELPPRILDYLSTAQESAQTLLFLLNDLLDFSRMEAGRFELDPEPFSLREVFDRTAKTMSVRADEKGLELSCRVSPDVPDVLEGDGRRLRQIVTNLVSNAIKFTEQGEVIINVDLATDEEAAATRAAVADRIASGDSAPEPIHGIGTLLHITVSDTGIGIDPEDQQRIFAPFTQADYSSTRRFQGTGLGLAICRELSERMGGRIYVESEPGRGSSFHVTFRCPVIRSRRTGEQELRLTMAKLRDTRVLVVDDNSSNCRILDETLKQWRMRPIVTDRADEALDELRRAAASERPFPVVLVDALMPDVDGFMFIEQATQEKLLGESAILMLSSADRQTFQERCESLGIVNYLEKPVSQSDLLDAVTRVLHIAGIEVEERMRMRTTSRPLHLLVAEDTPANQKVVRAILEKRGHEVTLACNGSEAVASVQNRGFDAILMDVQMPRMDGYQATRKIRGSGDRRIASIPIIAMTAHALREDMQKCLDAGMDAYISKPIDAEKLIRITERSARMTRVSDEARGTLAFEGDSSEGDSSEGVSAVWEEPSLTREAPLREEPVGGDPPATLPVFDRERALQRLGGDEELLADLTECFITDAPELLQRLEKAWSTQAANDLARSAHSLKSLAANFEAVACRDAALAVEMAGRHSNFENMGQKLDTLRRALKTLIAALQREGLT